MTENQSQSSSDDPKLFLRLLKKSRLVSEDRLQKLLKLLETNPHWTVQDVINRCTDTHTLSSWQCLQLRSGKYKGFFIGNFKLISVLGSGGMSTVYLAAHKLNGQQRAIKILPREKLSQRSYLARFYREGRAVAALKHPNIVRIYDIANQQATHYMVMEYIDGIDLYNKVRNEGPQDLELCRSCMIQSAKGLAHAHDNSLIHRDIKPANLLLSVENRIKVLDLGLSLLTSDDDRFGISRQHNETMMGTVDYLAPEQAVNSHEVDHRADIYSLGCTMYHLITGQPPFPDGTLAERIAAHQNRQPTTIHSLRPDCPPVLEQVCNRMMSKNPDDRYADCSTIIRLLEQPDKCLPFSSSKEKLAPSHTGSEPAISSLIREKRKRQKRLPLILVSLGLLIFIIVLIAVLCGSEVNLR